MTPLLPCKVTIHRKVGGPTAPLLAFDVVAKITPQLHQWCDDNCVGGFVVGASVKGLKPVLEGWFEEEQDAALFKLRWS